MPPWGFLRLDLKRQAANKLSQFVHLDHTESHAEIKEGPMIICS